MPPASLSTTAVIKPGPMTEKNTAMWYFSRFSMPSFLPQYRDDIVCGDHAHKLAVSVDYGQCQQHCTCRKCR